MEIKWSELDAAVKATMAHMLSIKEETGEHQIKTPYKDGRLILTISYEEEKEIR